MASAAQIRANRENAQRSTGPRSEAGKQATKYNALTHCLAAESLVIRGEDPAALESLRAQLQADYAPACELEAMLVDEVAQCWWRLRRARAQETRSINVSMMAMAPYNAGDVGPVLRYIAAAERAWHRAIAQLRCVQNDRRTREQSSEPAETEPVPAGSAQTEEPEKVSAVGFVPQNTPVPAPPSAAAKPRRILDIPAIMRQLEIDIQNTEEEIRREQNEART